MLTIKHILFPCDFRNNVRRGSLHHRDPSRFNARVTLLSVTPPGWAEPQSRLETELLEEFAGFQFKR